MFDIRIYGNPVLRKTARAVDVFDEKLKQFVKDMIETMRVEDGVGLAAPQVGESVQIAVIDITAGEGTPYVLINPVIFESSEDNVTAEEGCLSLPGITVNVTRPAKVSVRAFDENGTEYEIRNADGLLARALQHEIDHLNGIMIVDHISALQKTMINKKLKKLTKIK
ncbi:MAG: peptide deformylase [Fibrobacter sp.]|nr:peptide deformylase [Fibrobacter sp.]